MLKCDFHLHSNEDKKDWHSIDYSAKQLIDFASTRRFDVLALTHHNSMFWNKEIAAYAKKKKILLIPGIELEIEKKEYLILAKKYDPAIERIKTYEELRRYKQARERDTLIIMPHLFYPKYFPLGYIEYLLELFSNKLKAKYGIADAFEYSHFYLSWLNPNRRAVRLAKELGRAVVGNSDAHHLWQMDHTFTLLDAKKDLDSVFAAIKANKASVLTRPFFWRSAWHMLGPATFFRHKFYKLFPRVLVKK